METTMKYVVLIERDGKAIGASVPDLPGCYAVGKTAAEVEKRIRGAIEFHIEGLRLAGLPVPEPTTTALEVAV